MSEYAHSYFPYSNELERPKAQGPSTPPPLRSGLGDIAGFLARYYRRDEDGADTGDQCFRRWNRTRITGGGDAAVDDSISIRQVQDSRSGGGAALSAGRHEVYRGA